MKRKKKRKKCRKSIGKKSIKLKKGYYIPPLPGGKKFQKQKTKEEKKKKQRDEKARLPLAGNRGSSVIYANGQRSDGPHRVHEGLSPAHQAHVHGTQTADPIASLLYSVSIKYISGF